MSRLEREPWSEDRPREPAPSAGRWVIGATLVLMVLIVLAAAVLLLSGPQPGGLSAPGAPAAPPAATAQPGAEPPEVPETDAARAPQGAPPAPQAPSSTPPVQLTDADAAVRLLARARGQLSGDQSAALDQFNHAVRWLGSHWAGFDAAGRTAALDAIVEFVYAAAAWPDAALVALATLEELADPITGARGRVAADQVLPSVWAAGTLVRLARERNLPVALVTRIDAALVSTLGADRPRQESLFETGARAALRRLPLAMLVETADDAEPVAEAFARWLEAVAAALAPEEARQLLIADALEQVLRVGPEAASDRGAYAAVRQLSLGLSWQEGSVARARLIDWLRDQRVSSADLNVLTTVLATESAAPGLTPDMALAPDAEPGQREELATRYAAAWQLQAQAPASDDWASAVVTALSQEPPPGDALRQLALLVELARLHQAARFAWSGRAPEARALVRDASTERLSLQGAPSAPGLSGLGNLQSVTIQVAEQSWAARYLAAGKNIPLREELLKEIDQSGPQNLVDAEVLVEAACFSGPASVRAEAQRLVAKFAAQPAILAGMLEALPRAPRIESISRLAASLGQTQLPPPTDPRWMLQARRGLVERLTQTLAAAAQADIDRLAASLASAYLDGPGAAPAAPTPDPLDGLRAVAADWSSRARAYSPNPAAPIPLEHIEQHARGRAALAAGPIQAFAAAQCGLVEHMTYVLAGEQPARSAALKVVLDQWAEHRAIAPSVFEQMIATERALLRLWLIRLDQEDLWHGS
ncbi:MAG TPA: hypothetical protein VD963_01490 [Phycisphaerales bacterium]|nr:hypothetical protein [Phycisphaerales bacterium]